MSNPRPSLIPEIVPEASTVEISLDRLPPNSDLGGKEPDKKFVDSVKRFGIINPITLVGWVGTTDNFVVAAGRRRIKAARQAGFTKISARVYAGTLSPHVILLVENAARSGNASAEFLSAISLLGEGHDITAIRTAVGMGKATADKLLRLQTLTPVMLRLLCEDRMATETAYQAAKLSVEEQDSLTRGKEAAGRVTGADVREILQAKQEIAKAKARAEAEAAEAEAAAKRKEAEEERKAKAVKDAVAEAKAEADERVRIERERAERQQAEAVAETKRKAKAEQEEAVAQARAAEAAKAEKVAALAREEAAAKAERKRVEAAAEATRRARAEEAEEKERREETAKAAKEIRRKLARSWPKKALISWRMVTKLIPSGVMPPRVIAATVLVKKWLESQMTQAESSEPGKEG